MVAHLIKYRPILRSSLLSFVVNQALRVAYRLYLTTALQEKKRSGPITASS